MNIKFLGAATSVTGSCHLVTTDAYQFLLDCGQFQGSKDMDALNHEDMGFDPAEIDFMILSHAHIDHSGRIPLLVKRGFTGEIYCTDATADLAKIMLQDSGYIHEKETQWKNKKAQRAGKELLAPLYTVEDATNAIQFLHPILYDQMIEVRPGIRLRFRDAGHILGSAITELWVEENGKESKIVFSGDLGVKEKPILRDPVTIKNADYLIMETTYGNRVHESNWKSLNDFVNIILKTIKRGGKVIIPSFAVGRTQELVYQLNRFYNDNSEYKEELDKVMVYIDSPLATSATEVFRRNAQVFDDATREYILNGDNPLDFKNLKFTRTSEESQALNLDPAPKIIISASGMCEAGRIKHHLKHNLWNPLNSIVFVGYQAQGTLGRSIVSGDKDVSIFGEKIHVEAEIHNLEGFSGHADRDGLIEWLEGFTEMPKNIFLVHGEEDSKRAFAYFVKQRLDYDCIVVDGVSEFELNGQITVPAFREKEKVTEQEMLMVKGKIAQIHDELEQILYNTHLVVDDEMTKERVNRINNIILELEKNTINLGSTITIKS